MKILVALDESRFSDMVIDELAARSWWGDTQFMVVHVVAMPAGNHWEDWGLAVDSDLRKRLNLAGEKLVAEKVAQLRKRLPPELTVESKVVEGHTCECITQAASDWDADLIVIGSHGRGGFERMLLGSVAEAVLMHSPCSVEIIKHVREREPAHSKKTKKRVGLVY